MANETTIIPENPFSDKYAQLIARFKTNVHTMYEQLFLIEQEAMKAIEKGELNFEERIRAFHDKINAIDKQINEWAAEMKAELETFALTISGDWEIIVNQYKQNIDSSVQSITKMFEQLTKNLMKNFLEFVSNIVPNANKMIEDMKGQGLLSFI
jgi:transketolase